MTEMTADENVCRNASMLLLGDQYEQHVKAFKTAVQETAKAKGVGFRAAAAHLAEVAQSQGEPPEVNGLFIAAGAEHVVAT